MGKLTHTVKGPIASFRSADITDIESLKLHFLPKQEGSGDPSPQNIRPITGWTGLNGYGAGFNVLPFDSVISEGYTRTLDGLTVTCLNGIAHITGDHNKSTWTNIIDFYSVWSSNPIVLPPGTYTASNGLTVVCKVDDADSYVNYGYTFTVEKQALVRGFYAAIMGEVTVDKYIPLVLTVGAERPKTYLPYKPIINIPITFPTGKNLLNTMDVNNLFVFDTVSPGRIDTVNVGTGNSNYVRFNQVFHAGTYTISGKISGPGVKAIRLLCSSQIASSIWNQYYNAYFIDVLVGGKWTFTVNEDFTIGVVFVIADGHGTEPGSIYDLQLEYGSEATDFEPWSPISAFYGGYIDPVAGEIVAEYVSKICDGTENGWNTNSTSGSNTRFHIAPSGLGLPKPVNSSTSLAKFSYFNSSSSPSSWNGFIGSTGNVLFFVPTGTASTVAEWKEYLSEHNLQICYKLATPIHIPIPAQDLKAFLDHNNFWSDTNDDTEVEYTFTDHLSKRKLIMNIPHVESASGPVASFNTDMKAPIKELKAYFTPVQEGSGDPSPENVRPIRGCTGVNVYESGINIISGEFTTGYIDLITGTKQYNASYIVSDYIPVTPLKSYYFKCPTVESYALDIAYYDKNKNYIGYADADGNVSCNTPGRSRKMPANCYFIRIDTKNSQYNNDICINYPALNTSYIAPNGIISVPIKFPAMKNLIDYEIGTTKRNNGVDYAVLPNYGINCQGTAVDYTSYGIESKTVQLRAGTYTFSVSGGVNVKTVFVKNGAYWFEISGSGKSSKTLSEEATIHFYVMVTRGTEVDETLFVQIESGSTATTYEPYTNTIYGGYIDLIKGELVKTHELINLKAAGKYSGDDYAFWYTSGIQTLDIINDGVLCNKCKLNINTSGKETYNSFTWYNNGIIRWTEIDTMEMTKEDYNIYLDTNPLIATYKLKTPIIYQLTPQTLKTLKSTNNIWSSANGPVSIKYWTH